MKVEYNEKEQFKYFERHTYEIENTEKVYGFAIYEDKIAILTIDLKIFTIGNKEPITYSQIKPSTRLEFYNNGNNIAVIEDLGWIRLLDLSKNEIFESFQVADVSANHSSWAFEITKDNVLLCGGNHHSLIAIDLVQSKILYHWNKIHNERIMDLSYYNHYFLTCSWDKTVKRFSLLDYKVYETYSFTDDINSVIYLNQDEFLLGFSSGCINVYNIDNGKMKYSYQKKESPIFHIRFINEFLVHSYWKNNEKEQQMSISHPFYGSMNLIFQSRIWCFNIYGNSLYIIDTTSKKSFLYRLKFWEILKLDHPRQKLYHDIQFYFK